MIKIPYKIVKMSFVYIRCYLFHLKFVCSQELYICMGFINFSNVFESLNIKKLDGFS